MHRQADTESTDSVFARLWCRYFEVRQFEAKFSQKNPIQRKVAKNVAKVESGSYAGLKYYTVLNSSLTERVNQINRKTVNKQKTETFEVRKYKAIKIKQAG